MFRHGRLRQFVNDRSFVLIAVRMSAEILSFVPEHWRDDKEIMLMAMSRKSSSVHLASARLKADREYALAAVCSPCRSALSALPHDIRANAEIVAAAVATHGHGMLEHADKSNLGYVSKDDFYRLMKKKTVNAIDDMLGDDD